MPGVARSIGNASNARGKKVESCRQPAEPAFRPRPEQAALGSRQSRQERPGFRHRVLFLRRDRGHLLRRGGPPRRPLFLRDSDLQRSGVARQPGAAETPYLGAGMGGAGENRFSMFVGPKDIDILQARQSEAGTGGGFRLVQHPRQAAVPVGELGQQPVGAQLRLVHRGGDGDHQLPAAAVEVHQPEVDEEDAASAAADRRDQREVQGHRPARPAQGRTEPGGHGAVQEARRQPDGRMHADGASDPVLHRVLQGADGRHRDARRTTGCG